MPKGFAGKIFLVSVNTMRIGTMIDPFTGEPFITYAVHRFGSPQSWLSLASEAQSQTITEITRFKYWTVRSTVQRYIPKATYPDLRRSPGE